jgi:hypothetical protein
MKPADLPEEETNPKENEPPQREPKVVVHRGMTTHYPSEADRSQIAPPPQPESLADNQPEFPLQVESQAASPPQSASAVDIQADSPLQPESPADVQPESPLQVDSPADNQLDSHLQVESQATLNPQTANAANLQPESPPPTESRPTPSVQSPSQEVPPRSVKEINPGLRLRAFEAAAKMAPPAKIPLKYRLRPNRELTRRAYWDVASAVSLIVNVILISVLFIMAAQLKNLKTTVNGLLSGLYSNLVDMDKANMATTVIVETQIPVSFDLPIQQNTDVILTSSVPIPGANIIINSGSFSVNAPANITLPAGTNLPIALNISVPVQMTVPISLQLPVNIPLNQTNLQAPLTGLQTTVRRLYCTFDNNAQYPEGVFICAGHDIPAPGTP